MTSMSDLPPFDSAHIARVHFRDWNHSFGIKTPDRLSHTHIIGKTGAGKSTLLETLLLQDIAAGQGLTLIDPHGDLVSRIAALIPPNRKNDVLYFNVPDHAQAYGYNPLKYVVPEKRSLVASGLLEVFHKLWGERAWGQRLEQILRNAMLVLLDQRNATLPDLLRLLRDDTFRKAVASECDNEEVRNYWLYEYPKYSPRYRADAIAPIQNKVGAFLADPNLNRILTRPKIPLQFRRIMDERKILLVNLAKGQIGEDSAHLLGGLLVTTLALAAFSRADSPHRPNHFLYVDEFQSFTTLSVANMLSELRKYQVGMVFAHQYFYQLDPAIQHAVLGNAGTLISFRVGAHDAPILAREFAPTFSETDLIKLPNYHIYLKLMIDGAPSRPFSAITLPPWDIPDITRH